MFEFVFSLKPQDSKHYPLRVPLSLASAKNTIVKRESEQLSNTVYTLLKNRREALARGEHFDDLLASLLNAKDVKTQQGLNDEELKDELLTLFAAGHETTANALVWALVALSENPESLRKLKTELDTLSEVSSQSLKNLPFLQAIVKETLRLYPAIPFAPRVAVKNTKLAEFTIPKGSKIFVSIYSIHRNKSLWGYDAEQFKPERFLDTPTHSAYLPFGLGERVCIGQHLAGMELQVILATLLKSVSLSVLDFDKIIPKVAISLQTKEDVFALLSQQCLRPPAYS